MKHRHHIGAALLSIFFGFAASSVSAADTMQTFTPEMIKKQSEDFMEKNKNKKGIVTLPSGLQYEVISQGSGKQPGKSDIVTVDYEGKLINGKVFDSSYTRGQPASFPVNGVIPGWTEALQLMHEGSTWMLYIPPTLAYGEAGAGGLIGPNEALIFKVHLISVK